MKQSLNDLLFNLIISMFIGLIVGMTQITAASMNYKIAEGLIVSSIIGGVVGTVSRAIFMYMFAVKQKDVKLAFLAVFITIGVISCIPGLFCHFIYDGSSIAELMLILITAEFLGMLFCYYSYKKYLAFNLKLKTKKSQFARKKYELR